jgi:hypothetical protein
MEKLEHELTALRSHAEMLTKRHTAADAALSTAKAALQRHHLECELDAADDRARAKLEASIASCTVTRDGYADAMAELQAKIASTEQQLADAHAVARRKEASERLAHDLDAVEQALPDFLVAGRKLADAMDAIHHHYETVQMSAFLRNTSSQLEVASAFATQELRTTVRAIADGSAPIPPRKPEPQQPAVVVEPPPPTKTVFMMKSARFTGHDGRRHFAGQWTDQELLVPLAHRALRHGIAVPTTHPMRATHLGMRGSDYVADGPDVVDLDTLGDFSEAKFAAPNDPVLRAANFTVIDRSREARKIAVAGPSIL